MGDISDLADVGRFSRSREGARCLEAFRSSVVGKRIVGVDACNQADGLALTLLLEGGDFLDLTATVCAFSVDSLRDRYPRVLEREYYIDFPERRPPTRRGRR